MQPVVSTCLPKVLASRLGNVCRSEESCATLCSSKMQQLQRLKKDACSRPPPLMRHCALFAQSAGHHCVVSAQC